MLGPKDIEAYAQRLDEAEQTGRQIGQISLAHPDITIEDAYAIQRAWVAAKVARGQKVLGHKIGLTSKAMQRSSNISEPDYGVLLDTMFIEDGSETPASRFIVPRIEVELAFVLRKPLGGPDCSAFDVLDATDYVVPALELIDARIEQVDPQTKATRKVFDTISDNAANAAVIMGGRPVRPMDVDLARVSAALYRNGQVEESGVAVAVLNNPVKGPAWLARKLSAHGERLEAGQVILGGSFTAPVPARAGDTFHADYGPLGVISLKFT